MIQSKSDYKEYIKADKKANHIDSFVSQVTSPCWQYIKYLRKAEYAMNCLSVKYNILGGVIRKCCLFRLQRVSVRTGITIPPNTFGKGLYLPHYGCIIVNGTARFGDNCIVQCGVNVSENVKCGDKIYLGAGSKLMIGVKLQSGTIVGANAVVTKSFEETNIVLVGIPASIISDKGMYSGRKQI